MKNAFYLILKALFVLKIFKFLSRLFWSCRKNGLINKAKTNFKIYDATDWYYNKTPQTGIIINKKLQYTYYIISQEVKTAKG